MKRLSSIPCRVHILVCANRRDPGGLPCCRERGEAIFSALKGAVLDRGLAQTVWITETRCLGYCHRGGATVAVYRPGSSPDPLFLQAVTPEDIPDLIEAFIEPEV